MMGSVSKLFPSTLGRRPRRQQRVIGCFLFVGLLLTQSFCVVHGRPQHEGDLSFLRSHSRSLSTTTRCGQNTCQADEICCNESCGTCAPRSGGGGAVCTTQYCPPKPSLPILPGFDNFAGACFSGTNRVNVLVSNNNSNNGHNNARKLRSKDEDKLNEDDDDDDDTTAAPLIMRSILMKDLQVGDYVQTTSGKFSQVYAFGHYVTETPTTYLRVTTATASASGQQQQQHLPPALEVSSQHLIFVLRSRHDHDDDEHAYGSSNSANPSKLLAVAAKDVQIGDRLVLPSQQQEQQSITATNDKEEDPEYDRVVVVVTSIDKVQREGMYAPFTTDGTLVVDGFAVSSYVSLLGNDDDSFGMMTAFLSHFILSPYRLFCTTLPSNQWCHPDGYNPEGIPYYPAFLLRFFFPSHQQDNQYRHPNLPPLDAHLVKEEDGGPMQQKVMVLLATLMDGISRFIVTSCVVIAATVTTILELLFRHTWRCGTNDCPYPPAISSISGSTGSSIQELLVPSHDTASVMIVGLVAIIGISLMVLARRVVAALSSSCNIFHCRSKNMFKGGEGGTSSYQ